MRVVRTWSGEHFAVPFTRMLDTHGYAPCLPAKRTQFGYEPKTNAKPVIIQAEQIVEVVQG